MNRFYINISSSDDKSARGASSAAVTVTVGIFTFVVVLESLVVSLVVVFKAGLLGVGTGVGWKPID
jgi:hypothetical protein